MAQDEIFVCYLMLVELIQVVVLDVLIDVLLLLYDDFPPILLQVWI